MKENVFPSLQTVKHLRTLEFKPFVIFIKPPSIERLRETRKNAKIISSRDDQGAAKPFTVSMRILDWKYISRSKVIYAVVTTLRRLRDEAVVQTSRQDRTAFGYIHFKWLPWLFFLLLWTDLHITLTQKLFCMLLCILIKFLKPHVKKPLSFQLALFLKGEIPVGYYYSLIV